MELEEGAVVFLVAGAIAGGLTTLVALVIFLAVRAARRAERMGRQ